MFSSPYDCTCISHHSNASIFFFTHCPFLCFGHFPPNLSLFFAAFFHFFSFFSSFFVSRQADITWGFLSNVQPLPYPKNILRHSSILYGLLSFIVTLSHTIRQRLYLIPLTIFYSRVYSSSLPKAVRHLKKTPNFSLIVDIFFIIFLHETYSTLLLFNTSTAPTFYRRTRSKDISTAREK